jgi:F-BAR domain only protein
LAKELEDATDKADRLNRKGGKAASQKVDAASTRLESAQHEWDSQAPFAFESLQVLDEQRINQLRDLLTQFQTLAVDEAQREQATSADAVATMLEIDTTTEILAFSRRVIDGKPRLEKRSSTRQSMQAPSSRQGSSLGGLHPPGSSAGPRDDETTSEHSAQQDQSSQHDQAGHEGGGSRRWRSSASETIC